MTATIVTAPALFNNGSRYLTRVNQAVNLLDNQFLELGTDQDAVLVLNSAVIAADAEVTGLIVGTSNHQGTAADSLILSNITEDGDILMLVRDGSDSKEFLLANGDTADLQLGHGMATVTIKTASGDLTLNPGGDINLNANDLLNVGHNGNDWTENELTIIGAGTKTLKLEATDANQGLITLDGNRDTEGHAVGQLRFLWDGNRVAEIHGLAGPNTTNKNDGKMLLRTAPPGGEPETAIEIDHNKRVLLYGALEMSGDIAKTGTRVSHIYTTSQTTTNAETVDSWSRSKEHIFAYTKRALDIIRGIDVITFSHLTDRDPSGRIKLGVRAESIREPLALVERDYGYGLGVGPALDTMGLATLNTKAIQEIDARLRAIGA